MEKRQITRGLVCLGGAKWRAAIGRKSLQIYQKVTARMKRQRNPDGACRVMARASAVACRVKALFEEKKSMRGLKQ